MTDKQFEYFKRVRKLTDLQAKAIRFLYGTGKYSMRSLGAKYGVSRQTILNVLKEKTYKKGD